MKPSLIKARRATELASTTDRFFFLPVGIMLTCTRLGSMRRWKLEHQTWLALLVLKLATMLLESTAFISE